MKVANKQFGLLAALMLLSFFFTSCGGSDESEDNGKKSPYETNSFVSEWYCPSNYTYYNIVLFNFEGEVYESGSSTGEIYDTVSGIWSFMPSNNMLRMTMKYSKRIDSTTTDFKVIDLNTYSMHLKNTDLNTDLVFSKVVAGKTLSVGDSYTISYSNADFQSPAYSSSSSAVATVNASGEVSAVSAGNAFISIKQGDKQVFVKIAVK